MKNTRITTIIIVACWVVCSHAILLGAAPPAGDTIPFPKALSACDVTLKTMNNGNTESLMLGNGDLYGVVWRRGGGLLMRITKNDIWDARFDTSKDGPLPKVDIATGKITGAHGTSPSYKMIYPQPRCAAALRFGRSKGVTWDCIRRAHVNAVTPTKDHRGASIKVGGRAEASNGYRAILPGNPVISSFRMKLKGSQNASYYVDLFDSAGKPVKKLGWNKSPATETEIKLDLKPTRIHNIVIYTMTSDGRPAFNHIHSLHVQHETKKTPLTFEALETENLRAHLDLTKAVATIKLPDAEPTRIRILHDENVVLINTPQTVAIEPIKAATLPNAKTGKTDGVSWLRMKMPGDIDYKGMEYAIALVARGDLKVASLVTSWDIKRGDVLKTAIALAREALGREESKLIAAHERAWRKFWSQSGVALGDEVMQRWWYRMLYFAKTVCKPGAAPVALMPPLATDATPWHGDYHHNYNAWQAFWPLPAANQGQLADPWISYVHDMMPRFRYLAKVTYDIDGVFFPISSFLHEPDPAVCKSKNKRQLSLNPWGLTIGMVGMTVQSMWHKHLCNPDAEYMKAKIYPTLRQGAMFYTSFMDKCGKDKAGKIRLGPSYSPEHGAPGIYNCPFDIAYVHYTLDAFIQAAGELKLDADKNLAAKCRKYRTLLPDYPTAKDATGKSVVVDWSGCRYRQVPRHNIEVPATPVFPGDQVTWFSPEPVKELFRHTIRDTRRTGDNSHIMFNIARARLSMPEGFTKAKKWFAGRQLPNGFIAFPWAHGTFMQEQIGLTGLVNEFLLQSVSRKIRVFPCWPKDKDAAFSGLRAEGGFIVSAEQKAGKVTRLEVVSPAGGTLQLLSPWKTITANGRILALDKQGIVTLNTGKDEELIFRKGK
jgi:hypothetical protein